MDSKLFWKSRTFWTQLTGFILATLTMVLPIDYKPVIEAGIIFLMSILTVVFRWSGNEKPLGFKK